MANKRPLVQYDGQIAQIASLDLLSASAGITRDTPVPGSVSLYGDVHTTEIRIGRASQDPEVHTRVMGNLVVDQDINVRRGDPLSGIKLAISHNHIILADPSGGSLTVTGEQTLPGNWETPGISLAFYGGIGSAGDDARPGGAGGNGELVGGTGGAGSASYPAGPGGGVYLRAGDGGDDLGAGGASGGSVFVDGGAGSGMAANGLVFIGTENASGVEVARSGVMTRVTGLLQVAEEASFYNNVNLGYEPSNRVVIRARVGTEMDPNIAFAEEMNHSIYVAGSLAPDAAGGNLTFQAGRGAQNNGNGGVLYLLGGNAEGTGEPGHVYVRGGDASSVVDTKGGSVYLEGGYGEPGTYGGDVHVLGGSSGSNGSVFIGTSHTSAVNLPDANDAVATVIGGVEQGQTYTGENIKKLHDGSDATGLHYHTGAGGSYTEIDAVAGEALAVGQPVLFYNDAGAPRARLSDADSSGRQDCVGLCALDAPGAGSATKIRVSGEIEVAVGVNGYWDTDPTPADVGKRVYVSKNLGKLTYDVSSHTAPGDLILRVGWISRVGLDKAYVVLGIGEGVTI